MIISIEEEKAFGKIQHSFMIKKKNFSQVEIEGNFPNLLKGTLKLVSYLTVKCLMLCP